MWCKAWLLAVAVVCAPCVSRAQTVWEPKQNTGNLSMAPMTNLTGERGKLTPP